MAAYTIEVEQADDGGWSGMIDDFPGLLLMGETIEELIASAPEAIRFYLEDETAETNALTQAPLRLRSLRIPT